MWGSWSAYGLTPEQAVAQQLDLSFQVDDVSLISLGNFFPVSYTHLTLPTSDLV